jgi:hypothetical protein
MATNDFVQDLVEKLSDDKIEYLVIAIQKGKTDHRANAYYNITSDDGVDMILATVDEIFNIDNTDKNSDNTDDPDSFKEGAD